jgi:hypothetical protein
MVMELPSNSFHIPLASLEDYSKRTCCSRRRKQIWNLKASDKRKCIGKIRDTHINDEKRSIGGFEVTRPFIS